MLYSRRSSILYETKESSLLILLPNFCIDLIIEGTSTLKEIKEKLFYNVRALLNKTGEEIDKDFESYIFIGVNIDAEIEEYFDESQMLCNLNLVDNVLKYTPREKNNLEESHLNSIINHTIGITLDDINANLSEQFSIEIGQCRKRYFEVARLIYESITDSNDSKIAHMYCSTYLPDSTITIRHKLQSMDNLLVGSFIITSSDKNDKVKKLTELPKDSTVFSAIKQLLISFKEYYNYRKGEEIDLWAENTANDYILKVGALEEFMIDFNKVLINFEYVQNCLYKDEVPILSLFPMNELNIDISPISLPIYCQQNTLDNRSLSESFVNDTKFSFYIKTAQNLCKEGAKIYVKAALFSSINSTLCSEVKSNLVPDHRPNWNQILTFDIQLNNLPRNTRICISLVHKNVRKAGYERTLGSICLNLFDYTGKLIEGTMDLSLGALIDSGYYDSKMVSHTNFVDYLIVISVDFIKFRRNRYQMPMNKAKDSKSALSNINGNSGVIIQKIRDIVHKDVFCEILEQDRDFLRKNMTSCSFVTESLPKLAKSIRWNDSKEVGAFYDVLKSWGELNLSDSIQLLSGNYFDDYLRNFAVKNLQIAFQDSLSDVGLYLLQLVQALKYESYLYNDLAVFLLQVSLQDRNVGQKLFWYLRSEMHNHNVRIYFGVLLEAFCRGSCCFLKKIYPQSKFVDNLIALSSDVKNSNDRVELQSEMLRRYLFTRYSGEVNYIYSLIKPSELLGEIIVDNCKVKHSKKRPLYLEWRNPDAYCNSELANLKYIFKNGDDLRQDILTLQLLSIFDWIWKRQFQDMKMLPYGCLSVGNQLGLIEVVKDSKTVMDIQKKSLQSAFQINPKAIYDWLLIHNKNPEQINKAVENFTKSCAGYSVATFVLGIRDRHPDNIMVNRFGQLFHIDFGHILNNTKKKLGINRERVPFVLPHDFLYVIGNGADDPLQSQKFLDFKVLCGQAYLELRRQSSLILTLFSLMIHSGLPELSSIHDLEYIRDTLQVETTDTKSALDYFNKNFNSAYMESWSTKLDWMSHYIKNPQTD